MAIMSCKGQLQYMYLSWFCHWKQMFTRYSYLYRTNIYWTRKTNLFEWASDCCLTPIFSYIMVRTNRILMRWWWWWWWCHFVLGQNADFDFYSASSLKQHSAGRHVVPLGHIILILIQLVFALTS